MVEEELLWIEEDEAHQEEDEACQEEEEETADVKMVDEEGCGNPESSGPCMEANTKDIPLLVSGEECEKTDELTRKNMRRGDS